MIIDLWAFSEGHGVYYLLLYRLRSYALYEQQNKLINLPMSIILSKRTYAGGTQKEKEKNSTDPRKVIVHSFPRICLGGNR